MKCFTTLLLSLLISSCNVIQIVGGETNVPDDFFDGSNQYKIGTICSAPEVTSSFPFHAGTGTQPDPYIICDINQLQSITNDITAYYKLDADFNASAHNFQPIGSCPDQYCNTGTKFTGGLDGNGYMIDNFTINISSASGVFGVGLFANIGPSSYVRNIRFNNASINAESTTATVSGSGVVGYISGWGGSVEISNISFNGNINLKGQTGVVRSGMIVGSNTSQGYLQDVKAEGSLNISATSSGFGVNSIGTLSGYFFGNATRVKSKASLSIGSHSGTINNISSIGGLFGQLGNPATAAGVTDCYYNGSISLAATTSSKLQLGGIVGFMNPLNIARCWSSPQFSIADTNYNSIGGIIGYLAGSNILTNSFSDFNSTNFTSATNSGPIVGEMSTAASSVGSGNIAFYSPAGGTQANTGITTDLAANYTGSTASSTLTGLGWDFTNVWFTTSGFPSF